MIRFDKVTKTFGTKRVLNKISFETRPGEILFVIGKSGSGKSVVLKHIVGLLRADSGSVDIDGARVDKLSEKELAVLRRKCGLVFQQPALFDSESVYDNIAFGLRAHRLCATVLEEHDRIQEVLELVRLPKRILDSLPSQVSYGMQKRVGLARALVLRPRCLLYDEPTTGLDPVTTSIINNLIRNVNKKGSPDGSPMTSIVVSHDMHCALEIADRVMMLHQGKIICDAAPSNLERSEIPEVLEFLSEAWRREAI